MGSFRMSAFVKAGVNQHPAPYLEAERRGGGLRILRFRDARKPEGLPKQMLGNHTFTSEL